VRSPYFNATMSPNGMMQIWSGCLLRCQSEAQLAAIIGHETGHYLARHGIDRFHDAQRNPRSPRCSPRPLDRRRARAIAGLTDAVIIAASFAVHRDQEREADTMGSICARRRLRPEEAANVWAHLIAEREARENQGFRDLIFATHPVEEEREAKLRALAKGTARLRRRRAARTRRYLRCISRERARSSPTSSKLRDYGASIALFERMLANDKDDIEVAYNLGEVYRLRARDGDRRQALERIPAGSSMRRRPPEGMAIDRLRAPRAGRARRRRRGPSRVTSSSSPSADDAAIIRVVHRHREKRLEAAHVAAIALGACALAACTTISEIRAGREVVINGSLAVQPSKRLEPGLDHRALRRARRRVDHGRSRARQALLCRGRWRTTVDPRRPARQDARAEVPRRT
jgi:hypothetical protein